MLEEGIRVNLRSKQEVLSKLKNTEGGPPKDPLVEAVRAELEDVDLRAWFHRLAENGTDAIEAQAWQVVEVLKDRGKTHDLRDVQDAMLQLAHELLPESPAGARHPHEAMLRAVDAWISCRSKEDQERYRAHFEEHFPEFWEASASEFRKFLRECCRQAMEKGAA